MSAQLFGKRRTVIENCLLGITILVVYVLSMGPVGGVLWSFYRPEPGYSNGHFDSALTVYDTIYSPVRAVVGRLDLFPALNRYLVLWTPEIELLGIPL